jgi:hypothetical protein
MTLKEFISKAEEARLEFEDSFSHKTKRHMVSQRKILAKYFDNQTEVDIADLLLKIACDEVQEWNKKLNK